MNVDHILAMSADEKREARSKARSAGICIHCLSAKSTIGPRGGKQLCDGCRANAKAVAAKQFQKHRTDRIEGMRSRAADVRRQGVCHYCRSPLVPRDDGTLPWNCPACIKIINERRSGQSRLWRQRERLSVLALYGGRCQQCGFDDARALNLHHINGGGTSDPRGRGAKLIHAIKRDGYDPTLVLLCANCHYIRHWEEGKPRSH